MNVGSVLFVDLVDISTNTQQGIAARIEDDETVVAFARRHVPVVSQTAFESQARVEFVTVVRKESEGALFDTGGLIAERDGKRICGSVYECSDTGKVERARCLPKVVVEKLPVLTTDLQ